MSEDNCADNCHKDRIALGDLTNQLKKRAFTTFSGGLEDGFVEIKEKDEGKRILVNGNEGVKKACVLPRASSEINSLTEHANSGISKAMVKYKEPDFAQDTVQDALGSINKGPIILDLTKTEVFPINDVRIPDGDKLMEISTSLISKGSSDNLELIVEVSSGADDIGTSGEAGDEAGDYCEIFERDGDRNTEYGDKRNNSDSGHEVDVSLENAHGESDLLQDEGDHHGVDDLVQSQTGSVDHNRLPLSQESRCFGIERCTNLKGGDCSNANASIEMIKTCTCSFCTKAAYIWTDLHYQDFKGRVATIKKSEKEARLLAEKHGNTPTISTGVSGLESQLMGQWRSLFYQMEKIYEHEGNQLATSLLSLNDLREKCKVDLEFLNRPGS